MRRVECWACGQPVAGSGPTEVEQALMAHLREAHGEEQPDVEAVRRWVERESSRPNAGAGVVTAGRVLAGAAAVTFLLLAVQNPSGIGGAERTIQLMGYLAFAALAGAVVCVLTLLQRLLQR